MDVDARRQQEGVDLEALSTCGDDLTKANEDRVARNNQKKKQPRSSRG